MSVVANATLHGEPLPDIDTLSYGMLLAAAGHDTTSSSVGIGMMQLASNPAEFAKLKADPSLRKACEEGAELERQALHRTLYDAAVLKKDLNAAQFLLKHRHNYVQATSPSTGRVDVNVNARGGVMVLPPEMTLEEWEKRASQTQALLKETVRD